MLPNFVSLCMFTKLAIVYSTVINKPLMQKRIKFYAFFDVPYTTSYQVINLLIVGPQFTYAYL